MTTLDPDGRGDIQRIRIAGEWIPIRLLVDLCRPRSLVLLFIILLATVAFLLEGIGIGLLIPLMQTLLAAEDGSGSAGPLTDALLAFADRLPSEHRMIWLGAVVFILVLLKTVAIYAHHSVSAWLNGHVSSALRQRLFRRALHIGMLSTERLGVGRLQNTIEIQVWHVSDGLDALTRLAAGLAATVVFTTLLLLISWQLTLFVVVSFAAVSMLMRILRLAAQRFSRQMVEANSDVSTRIVESLTHHRLIRAFGAEHTEAVRFGQATEWLRRTMLRTELVRGIVAPGTELLYLPLMFATIAMGLALDYGMPTLLAFLFLLYRLVPHLRSVDHTRVELAAIHGPLEDVITLLRMPEGAPASGSRRLERFEKGVALEDVSFVYPGTRHGVLGVSFAIGRGEVVALVGPSGSGKSTIVNLIYRFFDPGSGRILVDGIPLPEIDLADWRSRLAIAGQDIELMLGSVRENIAFGRPDASDAEIRRAAREAHADEFIEALPAGYQTMVGARGLSLSGGQRQRLSLARALLRRPDLLILDEATNALDGISEETVLERLRAARGDSSVLVIAHRMSTVREADRVVVLDEGKVREVGPPDALTREAGAFHRLINLERK